MPNWAEEVPAVATVVRLGRRLVDHWELWRASIDALGGPAVSPMFDRLAATMRTALA